MNKIVISEVLEERAKTHGDFGVHALVTQELKRDMKTTGNFNSLTLDKKEALEMIMHKVGRIVSGDANYRDHWDDIAGYATLAAERCDMGKKASG